MRAGQVYLRQLGACSDGKRFIRKSTGFFVGALSFDAETVVGRTSFGSTS